MEKISRYLETQGNSLILDNMTDFTSKIQQIPFSADRVYALLSDLNNIRKVQSRLPGGMISDLTYDKDSCRFKTDSVGTIAVRISEREPCKTIKLISEKSPVPFTGWIQLAEDGPTATRLKLTVNADIPFLLKGMVTKPVENVVKKLAEALATLPY
jgi:carbon monoxide dehydrogenase subunit G